MTEINKIRRGLSRNGREAYKHAKENGNAFIIMGNSIYQILADGSRKKLHELSTTRVKAKQKSFVLK